MNALLFEITVVMALILANGMFAMAEMALVAARSTRLRPLADRGDRRAKAAIELMESPSQFLSTVQLGISLVGILAATVSGATIALELAETLKKVPWIGDYASLVSVAIVVTCITFASVVLGELIPKRLALNAPEAIALRVAIPMGWLLKMSAPMVNLLTGSTDLFFRLFRIRAATPGEVTDEEVKGLLEQGRKAGIFHPAEVDMVEGVMRLDRMPIRDIMVPRPQIVWIDADDTDEVSWRRMVGSSHHHFPVYQGSRDNVLGIVSVKSLWANLAVGIPARIRDHLTPPLIVPSSISGMKLLETFQREHRPLALVTDEYGGIEGLITVINLLEAIVGELPDQTKKRDDHLVKRQDGSWLIDGMTPMQEFKERLGIGELPIQAEACQTVAGYALSCLERIPAAGDRFEASGFIFEILDMDQHRIDKIMAIPVAGREEVRQA